MVPVQEILDYIADLFPADVTDPSCQVITTTYFQYNGNFYELIDGVAMGSSLCLVVANFYMETFERRDVGSATLMIRCHLERRRGGPRPVIGTPRVVSLIDCFLCCSCPSFNPLFTYLYLSLYCSYIYVPFYCSIHCFDNFIFISSLRSVSYTHLV